MKAVKVLIKRRPAMEFDWFPRATSTAQSITNSDDEHGKALLLLAWECTSRRVGQSATALAFIARTVVSGLGGYIDIHT